jgi:hypothetical protein
LNESTDYDGAWKETLERFLPQFLELAFPAIHRAVDWSKPVRFLDTELQEIVRAAEAGTLRVDKLVEVVRFDGVEDWLLIHAEVQTQREAGFAERMFDYHCRIRNRFERPLVSLAVLADEQAQWRPTCYEVDVLGCRNRFEFPVCKLAELELEPWLALGNPVARVIAAHRVAQQTAGPGGARKRRRGKLGLVRSLLESGASVEEVAEVLRLMNWLLALPAEEEVIFREELGRLQKESRMPYISTYDRLVRAEGLEEGLSLGLQKGLQEGRKEGRQEGRVTVLRETIAEALLERFGVAFESVRSRLEAVEDEAVLRQLVKRVWTARSIAEFEAQL